MKKLLSFKIEEILAIVLFTALTFLGSAQILFRFVLNFSLAWTEELSRFSFVFLVYITVSLAIIGNRHARIEFIDSLLPAKMRKILDLFVDIVWLVFTIWVGYQGVFVGLDNLTQTSPALQLNVGMVFFIIPFTFGLMAYRIIQRIWKKVRQWEGEQQ